MCLFFLLPSRYFFFPQEALEKALKSQADAIELLPAEEVLRRLAQKGSGSMGGLNRETKGGQRWNLNKN